MLPSLNLMYIHQYMFNRRFLNVLSSTAVSDIYYPATLSQIHLGQ